MTQYKFTVNGQSVVGSPTWNPIGTLASLAITDPFNGANNQTCAYAHDDLLRIASANCGAAWSQTFSYDAFGNITKNGSMSFQPTYSGATNRMTSIGGSTPSYDADGNVTNDFLHSYTWDTYGRPTTIDGVNITYDALGRMVEQNRSGAYTQLLYSPTGFKMEILNGQSVQREFVPLPGGATAMYTTSGLTVRHPDWVGTSRLTTNLLTHAIYYDGAYAPFGEPYAQSGTADVSFTGMNQDTTANLYDFPAREYGIQGRWPSPDPAGLAAVDPSNPQSWNRYAYVRNSPLSRIDPTGMDDCGMQSAARPVRGRHRIHAMDLFDCSGDGGGGGGGIDTGGGGVPGVPDLPTDPGNTVCVLAPDGSGNCGYTPPGTPLPPDNPPTDDSGDDNSGAILIGGVGYPINGIYVQGPVVPFKPTVAYAGSVIIPVFWGLGPAFTGAYVPSQNLACGGLGVGASAGHNFSVGPQLVDANNAQNILSGLSFSAGYNSTPFQGAQGSINFSGSTGGYSAGIPGASASATYSWCGHF